MAYDIALARVLLSREHGDGAFEETLSALGTAAYSNPQRKWGKILTLAGAADVEIYSPFQGDGIRCQAQAPADGNTNVAVVTRALSPLPNGAVVRGRGVFTTDGGSTGTLERKFRLVEGATGAEVTGLLVNLTNSLTNSAQTFGPTTLSAAIRQAHVELKALAGNAIPIPTETVRVRADELLVEEILDLTDYQAGELTDTLQMAAEISLLRQAGTLTQFQGLAQRAFRLPLIIEKAKVAVRNRLLALWQRIDGDPLRLYVSSDDRYLPIDPLPLTIEQLGGGTERVTLEFALQHGFGSISRLRQGVNQDPFGAPPLRLAVTSPTVQRDVPCDIAIRYSAGAAANDTVTVQRAGGNKAKFTIPSGGISGDNVILFEGRTGKLWRRTLTARTDVSGWLDSASRFPRLSPGENEIIVDATGTTPAAASVGFYEVAGEPDY